MINPYDFVPVDWGNSPERKPGMRQDAFSGLTGTLRCRITVETPLFIPAPAAGDPKRFLANRNGEYIIPGTSLKGVFRNLVETIGQGCWLLFGAEYPGEVKGETVNYSQKLPRDFHRCRSLEALCPACRMFGVVDVQNNQGDKVAYRGRVGFADAVCTQAVPHASIYTIILSAPKPRHAAFYLENATGNIAGRKYYFHQPQLRTAQDWLPPGSPPDKRQNQHITPLDAGSTFEFEADFNDLEPDELRLLLYAVFLEEGMRHKIGYAKPAGLGSVRISPVALELRQLAERYRGGGGREVELLTGDPLKRCIAEKTAPLVNDRQSTTLNGLRHIWSWPPRDEHYAYPDRAWFNANPRTSLLDFAAEDGQG